MTYSLWQAKPGGLGCRLTPRPVLFLFSLDTTKSQTMAGKRGGVSCPVGIIRYHRWTSPCWFGWMAGFWHLVEKAIPKVSEDPRRVSIARVLRGRGGSFSIGHSLYKVSSLFSVPYLNISTDSKMFTFLVLPQGGGTFSSRWIICTSWNL